MTKRNPENRKKVTGLSRVSSVFLENNLFLKKYLKRFLYREQDIEDVVQETYIKARNMELSQTIEYPKAYLFRIAKNLALDELERRSRKMAAFIEESDAANLPEVTESLEEQIQAEQSVMLYCQAAARLPPRCREVYLLRKVHGLSHKEISASLGISLSAVGKHLTKGMLSCQRYIEIGGEQFTADVDHRLQAKTNARQKKEH